MDIIVLGAGVIGITTAYRLAKSGHNVKVIESQEGSALGCSFANGAQLSFSHIEPICSSASIQQIAKSAFRPKSFMNLNGFNKDVLRFAKDLIVNSSKTKSSHIAQNIFRINQLSRENFEEIIDNHKIRFNHSRSGIIHIFRNDKLFQKAKDFAKFQNRIGDKASIYNPVECVEKEPTLLKMHEERELKGGTFYPNDATGNPYLFCRELEEICRSEYGVEFCYNEKIRNIFTNSKTITGINTTKDVHKADAYVYCLGTGGLSLLDGVKIKTNILPVLGGSISIPASRAIKAPSVGITDTENRLVYSRIGNIFRAAGSFAINKTPEASRKTHNFIRENIRSTFSNYGDLEKSTFWQNYRPLRANSIPAVCRTESYPNFYINSGHGHLGWTMSCGSAEIIRRLIDDDDLSGFEFLQEGV